MDFPRAFQDPEVVKAFGALDALCGNASFTNYADARFLHAVKDSITDAGVDEDRIRRLVDAYEVFLDALEPHQPSADLIEKSSAELRASGGGESFMHSLPDPAREVEAGKMFYFVEGSGGYWVGGRPLVAHVRGAMSSLSGV